MVSGRILFCFFLVAAWQELQGARIPLFELVRISGAEIKDNDLYEVPVPVELSRARIQEGVPPPLCAGRCASPPAGPVCAFDATGTARTFATLCELEAVSCRESTYYAITSLGEC